MPWSSDSSDPALVRTLSTSELMVVRSSSTRPPRSFSTVSARRASAAWPPRRRPGGRPRRTRPSRGSSGPPRRPRRAPGRPRTWPRTAPSRPRTWPRPLLLGCSTGLGALLLAAALASARSFSASRRASPSDVVGLGARAGFDVAGAGLRGFDDGAHALGGGAGKGRGLGLGLLGGLRLQLVHLGSDLRQVLVHLVGVISLTSLREVRSLDCLPIQCHSVPSCRKGRTSTP